MVPNHYEVLGVPRHANAIAIRAAYRRLAKRYHPDVAKGSKEAAAKYFRRVHEAYEVLFDARQRAKYDAQLNAAEPRTSEEQPFPWPRRASSWTPQPQTAAPTGKRSQSGTRYGVRLFLTILAILDVLALRSSLELAVPLVISLIAVAILAAKPPNQAAAVGRSVYNAFLFAFLGFVGLLLAMMGILSVAVAIGIMK